MSTRIAALLLILAGSAAAAFTQDNSGQKAVGVAAVRFERPRVAFKPSPAIIASAEREIFDLINKKRAGAGLEPLQWNDDLAALARQHYDDMAEFRYFGHRGNDGTM